MVISTSRFPVPTICRTDATQDWFKGLRRVLQWNERRSAPKPLVLPKASTYLTQQHPNLPSLVREVSNKRSKDKFQRLMNGKIVERIEGRKESNSPSPNASR